MAPTVCLSELPITRSSVCPYTRRRQRNIQNGGAIVKQQRLQLRRIEMNVSRDSGRSPAPPLTPPESPLWEQPGCPNESCPATTPNSTSTRIRVPADIEEHWKVVLAQREGLLDIVVRTMALVRRNNILQEKVNALRAETREFIRSVLNNPENKCRQQRLDSRCKEDGVVSSTTTESTTESSSSSCCSSLPPSPDSTSSSGLTTSDSVSSSCCCSDWETEESIDSSSDES